MDLMRGKTVQIEPTDLQYVRSVAHLLGNHELLDLVEPYIVKNLDPTNIVREIHAKQRASGNIHAEIGFAAAHFTEIPRQALRSLDLPVIKQIVHHPLLQIEDEGWLFEFILECVEANGIDWRELFDVVQFEYLSTTQMEGFLKVIDVATLNDVLWEKLQRRLLAAVTVNGRRDRSPFQTASVMPDDDMKFDGIFAYLERESGGDILKNGNVSIVASSEQGSASAANVVDLTANSYFASQNDRNQWLLVNFNRRKVLMSHYELRAYNGKFNMKSWVLQGSNDRFEWTTIDAQSNNDLQAPGCEVRYVCRKTAPFQYFRIRMKENHFGNDVMVLANLEFYGELMATA
jgi:hypothetical protein